VLTPFLHFSLLFAQISLSQAVPARPAGMQDPLSRDTPQSAVVAFLEACRVQNYPRASLYLDLRRVPAPQRQAAGARLARELEEILDKDARFDAGALSRDPAGDQTDGLEPNRETIAAVKVGDTSIPIDLTRQVLASGLSVWLFAPSTLDEVPRISAAVSNSPIESRLPAPLVEIEILNTPIWRWIALAALALVLFALSRLFSHGVLALLRLITTFFGAGLRASSLEVFVPPMRLLLVIALFRAGMEPFSPSALLRLWLTRSLSLLFILGIVWFCTAAVDLALVQAHSWVSRRDGHSAYAAFQLGSRVLKVVIVLAAITALIGSWGYNTGTIWAGLGVGGLALALAAQKTIENLFGGVSVITDRPVAIGDVCKFDGRTGTVEDIGLRSTRLRTPERTMVTVPNAQFSSMTLENLSRRDKILFKTVLNLQRDTKPDQLRAILADITQMLQTDDRIDSGAFPARLIGIGQWSLDVEVFVHIRTIEWDRFLSIQQELLLKLLDAVHAHGARLALPTQVSMNAELRPPTPAPSSGPA
jgi:MscS family membrane protein